ncbi:hypothetical protein CCHR01_02938 [Colletotrichum chrysophilum]|uniref:Uncharacterized protein n=1 Tax=Colletotrichum chrysophilum TaxID=1836956 RepID=A0AAD9AW42_9PEZI|nr:hypothetical protein CCHR01_02938 [Colletotrichum chrysophilum]
MAQRVRGMARLLRDPRLCVPHAPVVQRYPGVF